ncbi:hypothetical protein LTR04_006390 [Oleoguttula sp. CCFEE 6159]|nr:hypothetical protein LTR04_006390 [Oleoguttula sp. CCFEE 6159]
MLSRFLPAATGSTSVYERMREDERSDASDVEGHAGMALDEQNLGEHFQDQDLDHMLAEAAESRITTESTAFLPHEPRQHSATRQQGTSRGRSRPRFMQTHQGTTAGRDDDDDVPESLLLEGHRPAPSALGDDALPPPVPGPSTRDTRAQWNTTRAQQRLHSIDRTNRVRGVQTRGGTGLVITDPKARAMYKWASVQNLDKFLLEVYEYFLGHGIWSILLARFLNLLMSGFWNLMIWLLSFLWIAKLFQDIADIPRLWYLHNFYHHLLEIPDTDIQTVSWQHVVHRLMTLRDTNPATAKNISTKNRKFIGNQSKQRMDASDIANRLMRRENYLIALFNKDILDMTLPLPFLKGRQFFSRTLEWNIKYCVMDFVFNDADQVRPMFLKEAFRRDLARGIRQRFYFAAVMNTFTAIPVGIFVVIVYFLRSFSEFKDTPSKAVARSFTPFAEWKFRQFNELWHLFHRRSKMAYPYANAYLEQFPNNKTQQLRRFVSFIAGALMAVLGLATLIDSELFLGFEITPGRTAIFYLTTLTAIYAATRTAEDQETLVHAPEFHLKDVIEVTQYCPEHWKDRLHTDEVRKEFSALYQIKPVIFLEEMLGIILTPVILWYSLPKCSERLVDFFREFTIHVDGLGYVCQYAEFSFTKGGKNTAAVDPAEPGGEDAGLREDYYAAKDGKMLASYYGFIEDYNIIHPGRPFGPNRHPSRRAHYPPPDFSGLLSPGAAAGGIRATSNQPTNRGQPGRRMPRAGPSVVRSSPMHSILLDPHHQPAMAGSRVSPRAAAQSRYSRSHGPLTEYREEAEEAMPDVQTQQAVSSSRLIEEDSNLGDSWKTTRGGDFESDTDGDNAKALNEAKGGGVLGLIYQFSKARTDNRGGTVI